MYNYILFVYSECNVYILCSNKQIKLVTNLYVLLYLLHLTNIVLIFNGQTPYGWYLPVCIPVYSLHLPNIVWIFNSQTPYGWYSPVCITIYS